MKEEDEDFEPDTSDVVGTLDDEGEGTGGDGEIPPGDDGEEDPPS